MTGFSEKEVIDIFSRKLKITDLDDVAILGRNAVIKCDMLVSSTDVPPGMKPWQVARKSVVSCASDLAAKGARPTAAMISLGMPASVTRSFVMGLADGFARASKEFGVRILGGDTNEASELVIDCCMVGRTADGRMPGRGGAAPGDIVVVSGAFGLPPAGLSILLRGRSAKTAFERRAVRSVFEPEPRQLFGRGLARFFSSSIDSSDGLAISLYQLAADSGVDIALDVAPAAKGVDEFAAAAGLDPHELVFHGGEEYEIVATVPRSKITTARAAAKRLGLELLIIGSARRGSGRVTLHGRRLDNRGYRHFGRR
jgi:thiamine-monophosphate kinase